jgi:hypothetical protein
MSTVLVDRRWNPGSGFILVESALVPPVPTRMDSAPEKVLDPTVQREATPSFFKVTFEKEKRPKDYGNLRAKVFCRCAPRKLAGVLFFFGKGGQRSLSSCNVPAAY